METDNQTIKLNETSQHEETSNQVLKDEVTYFAETNFRNQRVKFGIKKDDRRRHMYVIGKTGMGKTVLLENMTIADIRNGHGVGVVDPHGEYAEKMLEFVPSSRINDVIYFNPQDIDFPISFNVMEQVPLEHRHLVASGLVGVFQKIWADSWGPRLEYVLRNAILALLEYPGSTLLGIMRMLTDKAFRKKVIANLSDPVVRSFWVDEYSRYPDRFQTEAVAPIQNKVGQFLSSPLIRNIVGQTKSKIDIRELMDQRKILIMNLSKGAIGEDASHLLGAMMITKIQLAAMSRVDMPEDQRNDFYLYVDEFQNFATESFANILSEARKYHLCLTLAHQYITQMEEIVRDAVFGNVGTLITFRVGAADAEFLEKEFEPVFTANDLVNLPKYNTYLKLMINGVASDAFSSTTLPPLLKEEKSQVDKIIRVSRERYSTDRAVIEDKISRWSEVIPDEKDNKFQSDNQNTNSNFKRQNFKDRPAESSAKVVNALKYQNTNPVQQHQNTNFTPYQHEAKCWACGKKTHVSFEPDGKRPIFCKDCLKKYKQGIISEKDFLTQPQQEVKEASRPISLKELSQKQPVNFNGQPAEVGGNKNQNENIVKNQPELQPAEVEAKTEVKPIINQSSPVAQPQVDQSCQSRPRRQVLKPGEVVNLD
ncbi:MAG: type IV secretion system DNA-binding domain-containing protein [Patescibacteria group bacterium]|nr:type IV secretion system DNA-binding domain-containing protein [Patescibacteria group bacterium]